MRDDDDDDGYPIEFLISPLSLEAGNKYGIKPGWLTTRVLNCLSFSDSTSHPSRF